MSMEYLYAALLLHDAKKEITEDALNSTVKAAGVQPDAAKAKMVVSALQGVNIEEVLKNAAAPVMMAAPAGGAAHAEAKKEAPKEEKKSEEEAAAGLSGLFG
jgi:large subunit ribosomal protein L12